MPSAAPESFASAAAPVTIAPSAVSEASGAVPAASEPAAATCLAKACVADLRVADFADGGVALTTNQADLGGGKFEGDIVTFFGHHLRAGASGANHLAAATSIKLDAVNRGTERDG